MFLLLLIVGLLLITFHLKQLAYWIMASLLIPISMDGMLFFHYVSISTMLILSNKIHAHTEKGRHKHTHVRTQWAICIHLFCDLCCAVLLLWNLSSIDYRLLVGWRWKRVWEVCACGQKKKKWIKIKKSYNNPNKWNRESDKKHLKWQTKGWKVWGVVKWKTDKRHS